MTRNRWRSWDLASSGATATSVAASWRWPPASPTLDQRSVRRRPVSGGRPDFCNRIADGELDFGADELLDRQQMCEQIAVRTRFF